MPYRVRAFCTGSKVPTLAQVFDYAKSQGVTLYPDETHGPTDVNASNWTEAEITYKTGKSPLVVECNRDDGTADCLARVEPQEFIADIKSMDPSPQGTRVIDHLKQTKFIIASQLLNDIDDEGYNANATFLNYFVEYCGGLVHADLEGFYEGDKILLELE